MSSSKRSIVQTMKITVICTMLILSVFTGAIDAKKPTNSRRGGSSSSKLGGVSGGRVSKPPTQSQANSHADLAKLSYSGYNQQPNAPKAPHASAPVAPPAPPPLPPKAPAPVDQSKPIGWNVDNRQQAPAQNAAPYPVNNHPAAAAPPPYSPMANQGPPPAYSQYPQHNPNPQFNQAPPAYSPGNQGFQPGYGQPAGVAPGGYPQQPHYGGAPPQGYPGQAAPGYGQPAPQVNNYYPAQQSSSGVGLGALNTALIAGVGGIALYGALKPNEQKTIIIYNSDNTTSIVPTNVTVTAAPGTETTTPVPLAPFPDAQVPLAPMPTLAVGNETATTSENSTMIVMDTNSTMVSENATVVNAPPLMSEVPLAPFPDAPQTTVATTEASTGTGTASALNSSTDLPGRTVNTAPQTSGSAKFTSSMLVALIPVVIAITF